MKKVKEIKCPRCDSFMLTTKADDDTLHKLMCRNCRKWIWFIPKKNYFEIHSVPVRTSLSGMRFY